jgi:hypothetical protein
MSLDPSSPRTTSRRQLVVFALLCVASIAGIVGYGVYAAKERQREITDSNQALVTQDPIQLATAVLQPHLLFRNTILGPAYGHIAVVTLASPGAVRYVTPLVADRVYGTKSGGFYLHASRRAFTSYEAMSFDHSFEIRQKFKLAGAPSRTRVSPNGKLAASTVFVSGDSYNSGGFSTRTTIFDLAAGQIVADLENFAVQKEGQDFKNSDFNFWGVTFAADNDHFYATVASGDVPYLIEGQVSLRTARVVRAGVECPSLSPDGTCLVFKSRLVTNGRRTWQLHVLNLKTQAEVIVSETRSVDDQAEWLDDENVIYALPRDTGASGRSDLWVARADGTRTATLFVADATSPCVIRP